MARRPKKDKDPKKTPAKGEPVVPKEPEFSPMDSIQFHDTPEVEVDAEAMSFFDEPAKVEESVEIDANIWDDNAVISNEGITEVVDSVLMSELLGKEAASASSVNLLDPEKDNIHSTDSVTAAQLYAAGDSSDKLAEEVLPADDDIMIVDEVVEEAGQSGIKLGELPTAIDSESSIFGGGSQPVRPVGPGSGWLDASTSGITMPLGKSPSSASVVGGPEAPTSGGSITHLFDMLHGSGPKYPTTGSNPDKPMTGIVPESEVMRAFDQLNSPQPTDRIPFTGIPPASSSIMSDKPSEVNIGDSNGSNLFKQSSVAEFEIEIPGESAVNLTGSSGQDEYADTQSSIFSGDVQAIPPMSSDSFAAEDPTPEESVFGDEVEAVADESSIFDSKSAEENWLADPAESDVVKSEADTGAVDWDVPVGDPAEDQRTMMVNHGDLSSAEVELDDIFFPKSPVSPSVIAEGELPAPPDSSTNFVGLLGSHSPTDSGIIHGPDSAPRTPTSGIMVVDAKTSQDYEAVEIDEPKVERKQKPAPTEKKKGGLVGWIGGGAIGLLIGAGAVGGAYFAELLPSSSSPVVSTATPPKFQANTAELAELKTQLQASKDELTKAQASLTTAESLHKAAEGDAKAAKDELTTTKTEAEKAKADLKLATAATDKAKDDLKTAQTEATTAKTEASTAKTELTTAKTELATAMKSVTDITTLLNAKAKELETATKLATDTAASLKTAEESVALVVKELKANKLIPDTDDTPKALAKLPDLMKQATAALNSTDVKKATEALLAAKKEVEVAQASLKTSEENLTKAKAEAATAKKESDDKAKLAAENAVKDSKAKIDELATKVANADAVLQSELKKVQDQMKAQSMEFGKQLAEARSGRAVIQVTPAEQLAQERSIDLYGKAVSAFFNRNYDNAEKHLTNAVKEYPADARYWYFLGLAQTELKKDTEAEVSFRKGAEWELRNKPDRATIGEDLQRIQGELRRTLSKYRP